jgi:hypothetical protein
MERIPASERTREKLKALMEGRSEAGDGRSESGGCTQVASRAQAAVAKRVGRTGVVGCRRATRQDYGGESSCPVMSRSPDRRSSLERGSPETKPRSCNNQHAHESLFNRLFGSCLQLCAPPSQPLPPQRNKLLRPDP